MVRSDSLESGPGAGTRSLEPDTWSPANEKPGLICILDNGTTGNSYVIRDCIFVNPATAISTEADHITIERNSFQACGCWNSNSVRVYQTAWSTNSEYSIGADITIENGGIGYRRIVGNQHFNGQAGYLNLDESHAVICQDEIFELMNYTAITEQGLTSIGFNFSQACAPAGNSADIIYCPDCPNSGGYLLTEPQSPVRV